MPAARASFFGRLWPALEAAARETAADARHREELQIVEQRLARVAMCSRLSLRSSTATSFCSSTVPSGSLGKRRLGQQDGLAGAAVEREVVPARRGDPRREVRQPPRDRDAEPRRIRCVLPIEPLQRLLEVVLRGAQVVDGEPSP